MTEIKNFTVINGPLVESLARQLNLPVDRERARESQFGLNGKLGAGVKTGFKQPPLPPNDPRLLEPIVTSLRESGQLRALRPETSRDFWRSEPFDWYVHESTIATPVLIPLANVLSDLNKHLPKSLTVWIIDPTEAKREPRDQWDWLESFVFIVQELSGFPWPARSDISGISALRMVAEVVAKMDYLDFDKLMDLRSKDDLFGRWHVGHPIDKLVRVGGITSRPRKIETIYKIAYMSDGEQSITVNGNIRRVNDILAYPLFIAE